MSGISGHWLHWEVLQVVPIPAARENRQLRNNAALSGRPTSCLTWPHSTNRLKATRLHWTIKNSAEWIITSVTARHSRPQLQLIKDFKTGWLKSNWSVHYKVITVLTSGWFSKPHIIVLLQSTWEAYNMNNWWSVIDELMRRLSQPLISS